MELVSSLLRAAPTAPKGSLPCPGASKQACMLQKEACLAQAPASRPACLLRPRSIWGVGKNYAQHIEELKGLLQGVNMDMPK
ncbi:hypothetical protein DUNSADRAFT_14850, partial [Dunaliella salina]